jgi:hypothetical protein
VVKDLGFSGLIAFGWIIVVVVWLVGRFAWFLLLGPFSFDPSSLYLTFAIKNLEDL